MNSLYRRAEKAEKILESLSEEKRKEIAPYIEEIKELQRNMDVFFTQFEVAQRCAKCYLHCCASNIETVFPNHYMFFLLFDISFETKFKIWQALQKEWHPENCRFLEKNGCILPLDSRAYICKSFLCGRFGALQKVASPFSEKLAEAFKLLQAKLHREDLYI